LVTFDGGMNFFSVSARTPRDGDDDDKALFRPELLVHFLNAQQDVVIKDEENSFIEYRGQTRRIPRTIVQP